MITIKANPLSVAIAASFLMSGCQQVVSQNEKANMAHPSYLPEAPMGYGWAKVESMSDEFDGVSLDTRKWRDHITTWQGRPPAEFLPSNVTVKDGTLALRTSSHPNPNDTYTMAGAAVSGRAQATFGYYEARIKASKTKMSTTFWLHSDEHDDKDKGCGKAHSTELDILETIGGWPEESWANVMRSNTHYKPTQLADGKCQGAPYLSKGAKFDSGKKLSDGFNTFSMWWVTPNQMHFYFNGELTGTVDLAHPQDELPFNSDMSLRMVVETYDWQPQWIPEGHAPYPTEAELDDMRINTAYYDHVRGYALQALSDNLIKAGGFEADSRDKQWSLSGSEAAFTDAPGYSYTNAWGLQVGQKSSAQQTFRIDSSGNYVISAYAKHAPGSHGGVLRVVNELGDTLASAVVAGDNFTLHQMVVSMGKSQTVSLRLEGPEQGLMLVDNVAVLKQ